MKQFKFYFGIVLVAILTVAITGYTGYTVYDGLKDVSVKFVFYAVFVLAAMFLVGYGLMRFLQWCFADYNSYRR